MGRINHKVYYALGLHMHQPPDNLKLLIETNPWEANQIMHCYERAVKYALKYQDKACIHIGFSGILLEQFNDPKIVNRYKDIVDIPQMIDMYREAKNIEFIGMGYYHPIFPLIPKKDWKEQINYGKEIIEKLFGKTPKGFWPPEMAFCMDMIPFIKKAGYEYIVVDHVHIKPYSQEKFDCFKPYIAEYEGVEINIIPRNRDLSNAQESGMNPSWFYDEVNHKLQEFPKQNVSLITTWSDGENGGWFRQMDEASGFFGYFFAPFVESIGKREPNIEMIKISDFLKKYPPKDKAFVKTGAWNIGSKDGSDFSQWAGSNSQKRALEFLFKVSNKYWDKKNKKLTREKMKLLEEVRTLILNAETSCYLFWGEAWLPKIYEKLETAEKILNEI